MVSIVCRVVVPRGQCTSWSVYLVVSVPHGQCTSWSVYLVVSVHVAARTFCLGLIALRITLPTVCLDTSSVISKSTKSKDWGLLVIVFL